MTDSIARTYPGQGPYEEVWFAELRAGPDRGLWIRYTLSHGSASSADVWAIAFTREGVRAHKQRYPLSRLDRSATAFRVEDSWVDRSGAQGQAGSISWRLAFEDRGLVHDPLPTLLKPLLTRQWVPAILDLRVSGTIEVGGEMWEIENEPGVLGHIWGKRNSLRDWAWAHCNTFPRDDAVFEGISARVDRRLIRRKTLSSFVLYLDGRCYRFSKARSWLTSRARYGDRRWTFQARDGGVTLEGEAGLPDPACTARVEYTTSDGSAVFCSNSRLSWLRLRLVDTPWGIDRELETREAAFELGSKVRPDGPLHLPALAQGRMSHAGNAR